MGAFAAAMVAALLGYLPWSLAGAIAAPLLVLTNPAYERWVPARCAKCGRHSSYRERGKWISYLCRICGARQHTGWGEVE